MTTANQQKIEKAMRWITEAIQKTKYGNVGCTLFLHDGKICKIEKIITEKMQDKD